MHLSANVDAAEPSYELYYFNDLDRSINDEGVRRIKAARAALVDQSIDPALRLRYERDQFALLDRTVFEQGRFEEVRKRAIAALADPTLSPCAFLHGQQAERQGIPREVIKHPVRCYTTDVAAVVPDVVALLNDRIVHVIRSCIGSNFSIENVYLTRNYHVAPEINAKYEMLSDRWHFDHQYPDGFTLFVCLSHVTERDGPTHAISAEHSRDLLALGFDASRRAVDPNGGLTAAQIEAAPSFTRLVGPPGSMMLCHTSYCLHRAGTSEPGSVRDMLMFTFRPTPEMDLTWPKPS